MDEYTRKMIQVAVAQTCLNVGWSAIQTSPMEIMTDLLSDYILGLCKRANNYAFLFNQTEPNLDHLGLAFQDLNISIPELEEYVTYFENNNCPEVPQYPVPRDSNLNFLKPGSREVVTRPVHVHEHLPPMYPQLEEQEGAGSSKPSNENSPPPSDNTAVVANEPPATPSPSSGLKRRGDHSGESAVIRRARALAEEESRPLREISSVMMTTSGFLSHAREGKLPEVRTIPIHEPEPEEPPEAVTPATVKVEIKSEPAEVKPEKKRKKKTHDSSKKAEKDLKIKEEPGVTAPVTVKSEPFPDDSQVKKLVTVKETSKLKVLKPGATKAIALTPDSSTPTSKPEKKIRNKRPHSPGSAVATTPTGQSKAKISKSDRVKERMNVDDAANDAFPDIKLTAEPDKQKLNIFKKISKVKDDHDEPKSEPYDHPPAKPGKDNANTDSLKKTSSSTIVEHVKEERNVEVAVDVENIHSPSAFGLISFGEDFMPETPATPKTPDIPKIPSDSKKKKREKHKDKKERERFNSSPVSSRASDDMLAKPKTPEVVVDSPDDHLPFPFLSYPTGPALIPPNLASNPLIPQMSVMPFPPKIPPPPIVQAIAVKEPVKEVPSPAPVVIVPIPPPVPPATPPTPLVTPKVETPPMPKKKDKKEKKNKDKIKKKKDKKDKLKAKDKSERKKLKLQKKQKLQEKLKLKREKKGKKKEAQKEEEKRGDSPSVPKITFKLGPDPQREQSPNPKITIKPVIKKEEDVVEVTKKHAPDPATTPTIKHHKGVSKITKAAAVIPSDAGHHHAKVLELAKSGVSLTIAAPPAPAPVVLKTEPDESNQLWICPACGRPDDGSPMIACDACDMWYHYICVGILEAPESDWFCQGCISKKPDLADKKKKHKKRK